MRRRGDAIPEELRRIRHQGDTATANALAEARERGARILEEPMSTLHPSPLRHFLTQPVIQPPFTPLGPVYNRAAPPPRFLTP